MKAELVCADGLPFLTDYLEDTLAQTARSAIDAHLAGCPRCLAFVRSYVETPRIFREATDAPLPSGVGSRLRAFLKERLPQPS
jgi:anti-sigma factor RsiW